MKNGIFVCVAIAALSLSASAGIWWQRGDPGTTWQEWHFTDDSNPAVPEDYDNVGIPTALIVAFPGTHVTEAGWREDVFGRQGVWAGDVLQIELYIPNVPPQNPFKDIWLTMEYYGDVTITDVFPSPPGFIEVIDSSSVQLPDMWKIYTIHWRLEPNPIEETIVIEIVNSGAFLNFLSVDTICYIPEPATLALLGLGGLAMLKRRQ